MAVWHSCPGGSPSSSKGGTLSFAMYVWLGLSHRHDKLKVPPQGADVASHESG